MQSFFRWLDDLALVEGETGITLWLGRAAFFFLVLMVLAAPHSIAATQTAMLTGMFLWVVGLAVRKFTRNEIGREADRPERCNSNPIRWLGYSLWAFFAWSVVSSLMSYEPAISLDRL